MANSKIKQILVGTTTYDIEDAGAAHLSANNTFTGTNTFAYNSIKINNKYNDHGASWVTTIQGWDPTGGGNNDFILTLPKTSGTITVGVKANGTIHAADSSGLVDLGTISGGSSGVTSVTTSGSGNAVTSASISGNTLTLTKGSTFLTAHQSLASCAKLSANNTFTGTNTFKVANKNNSIKIEPTGISIYSQVGPVGSVPGVVLCSDHPDTLKIKSTSSKGFIRFPELGFVSAQGETVALLSDIKIKSATLSGTTLTLTI